MVWAVAANYSELSWADADCIMDCTTKYSDFEKLKSIVKTYSVEEINIDFQNGWKNCFKSTYELD